MRLLVLFLLFVHAAHAATFTVSMTNTRFTPANLSINVGDTVIWRNDQGFHDTVSGSSGQPSGVWSSGIMTPGQTFSFTFNQPGTYPYYCTPHWTLGMIGSITVTSANSPPSVSIVNPPNGADFSAPANITVEATAFDADGDTVRVDFFMNDAPIGVRLAPPYSVTVNDLGPGSYTFSAVATDGAGGSGSSFVSVTVSGNQPTITTGPESQTANVGTDVLFTAQATGSAPLSFQWFFGATPIPNATDRSLLLTNVTTANDGVYTFQVSNPFGSASASATLTVTNPPSGTPPSITVEPESQTVNAGTNVTFAVGVIGSKPLIFQWFFNGVPITAATDSTLLISNITPADAGDYVVIVTNDFGSATSSTAILTVTVPPACDYALSKTSTSFGPGGGPDSVNVIAPPDCAWSVSNTNSWVVVTSGSGGAGPGTVSLIIVTNTTRNARSGVLVIAGNTFTVSQAAAAFLAKNDFNRDGYTDLLWQHTDGRLRVWFMQGTTNLGATQLRASRSVPPGSRVVGTADFNHDLNTDILWQHPSGRLEAWLMTATNFLRSEFIGNARRPGVAWRAVGIGDFNHDRGADILLRHREGYLLVWLLRNTSVTNQVLIRNGEPIPASWRVAAVADFNNNTHGDILWQSQDSHLVVWDMIDTLPITGPLLSNLPRPNARITGTGDLNQDGQTDLIWRDRQERLKVWWMNSTNRVGSFPLNRNTPVSPQWKLVAPKN